MSWPRRQGRCFPAFTRWSRNWPTKKECPVDELYFTRRMIREHTGWSDWQIRAHIKQLEELEYLHVRIGAQGKQYAYALNYRGQGDESGKCYLNLTPVEEIKKLMKKKKDG